MPEPNSMLEPDFAPHFNTWKANPTPVNTSKLVKVMEPVISSAVKSYAVGGASPTLHSKAKLIVIDALKSYDPTKAKLKTHMMSQLQGLRRASTKETQILSIPEQVSIDIGRLNEAQNLLTDKLGREPSTLELADHTGVSKKRIEYIRRSKPVYSEGMVTSPKGDDSDELFQPQVDSRGGDEAWLDFVYHDLDPLDQVIMEYSLGMHGKKILSNQGIAKRLRVSPGAISQRKAKIQNKLDSREELDIL